MREALAALPGVRNVQVDFGKKQAVVTVETTARDGEKMIQALRDAGFGGSVQGTEEVPAEQGTSPESGEDTPADDKQP